MDHGMTRYRVLTRAQRRGCVDVAAAANALRGRVPRGSVVIVRLDRDGVPFAGGIPWERGKAERYGVAFVRVPHGRLSLSVHAWEVARAVWPSVVAR